MGSMFFGDSGTVNVERVSSASQNSSTDSQNGIEVPMESLGMEFTERLCYDHDRE